MAAAPPFPVVADAPAALALIGGTPARRVLLFGAPGTGKSTLAAHLAQRLAAAGHRVGGIGADPGSPPFGPPGAASYGDWQGEIWALVALEPLCTLDAGRFRLPLAAAVRRLARRGRGWLLARDARRDASGRLRTAPPWAAERRPLLAPATRVRTAGDGRATGPCPHVEIGLGTATLVKGVFGDPLLHLRLRQQPRSLLFDLGESGRLPARLAHQVTDVFISHAHFDHIAGFLGLLRARVGVTAICRIFGPPGLADHVAGLVRGICWDRVGAAGPRFAVAEYDGERLVWSAIQAGCVGREPERIQPAADGLLWEEPLFQVRAQRLDHGIPVLAFALEQPRQFHVRPERLRARGLDPGPWLGDLKRRLATDDWPALIRLPDGGCEPAGTLAAELVLIAPGQKLVYATDLADTAANRARLIALAQGATVLCCEAAFLAADAGRAARTGHLTARACGEIAAAADVAALVPFHFSRRYQTEPERVYAEIRAVCPRLMEPRAASAEPSLQPR